MPSDDEEDSKPSAEPKTPQNLVQICNKSEADSTARKNCQAKIEECIQWFEDQEVGDLSRCRGKMLEYTALAHIEVKDQANKALLDRYCKALFSKLDEVVDQYKQGEEVLLEVLEYSLSVIDNLSVIDKPMFNTKSLSDLVNKLVKKLEAPENQALARDKAYYDSNRSILCALNQTFVLMREVSGACLDPNEEAYKNFKGIIKKLQNKATYYPLRYHALLIEQSLGHLAARGIPVTRTDVGHFLLGSLYLGQVAVKALGLTPDVGALERSYEYFDRVFSTQQCFKAKNWYELHQGMYCAALMILKEEDEEEASKQFEERFKEKLKDDFLSNHVKNERHRSALHFGIGKQLRLLALNGPTSEVRKGSITLLRDLAKGRKFTVAPKVREGLLEDLAAIAYQSAPIGDERGEEKRQALAGLEDSKRFLNSQQKSALEAIISATEEVSAVNLDSGGWFEEHNKAQKDLQSHYTNAFKYVPSLFASAGEHPKEVDTLQFTLKLIEPVDEQAAREDSPDEVTAHHARSKWEKTTIAPEDLFKSRSTKPREAVREINKVLVVGDAGMGKTTLSKQLAYRWAKGKWGTEFEAVYVLPVRNLSSSDYNNGDYRRVATLATAIVNLCFTPPTAKEDYEGLLKYVDKELKKPTTLVILDGLDERAGACEKILKEAEDRVAPHKLLMLSRSYGITEERHNIADIEVEHAGLSDEQMRDYVIQKSLSGLSEDQGKDLLSKIANHPSISEMAHVPVNLAILCFLWRDKISQVDVLGAVGLGSLPGLYRQLTEEVWERYLKQVADFPNYEEFKEGIANFK
jgi:hypothetical protein